MKTKKVNAVFTNREMQAIADLLLSSQGINVDPIIKDLYPNIDDESMSMFRCKMALLLSGRLPEFKTFEGFRKDSSRRVVKYRCRGESSLMGTKMFEVIEVWNKDTTENWVLEEDCMNVGNIRNENFDWELYDSIEEAEKHW